MGVCKVTRQQIEQPGVLTEQEALVKLLDEHCRITHGHVLVVAHNARFERDHLRDRFRRLRGQTLQQWCDTTGTSVHFVCTMPLFSHLETRSDPKQKR